MKRPSAIDASRSSDPASTKPKSGAPAALPPPVFGAARGGVPFWDAELLRCGLGVVPAEAVRVDLGVAVLVDPGVVEPREAVDPGTVEPRVVVDPGVVEPRDVVDPGTVEPRDFVAVGVFVRPGVERWAVGVLPREAVVDVVGRVVAVGA